MFGSNSKYVPIKYLFELISTHIRVTNRFFIETKKERVGLVFYGMLIWALIGQLSNLVGYGPGTKQKKGPHLNHSHGASVRDVTLNIPIFILVFGFASAINENHEEGCGLYQSLGLIRKPKKTKAHLKESAVRIDAEALLEKLCTKGWRAKRYIEDFRYVMKGLEISHTFLNQIPRVAVGLINIVCSNGQFFVRQVL